MHSAADPRGQEYRSLAGTNLRHLIGMHDLFRTELAGEMGISPTGLANIINGHCEPTLRTASRAALAFGISIDDLYADIERCVRAAAVAFEWAPVRARRLRRGEL